MWVGILLKALLFMLLVPGVHLRIPPGAPLFQQALIHGVFFAVANYLAYMYLRPLLERFSNPDTREDQPCPTGSVKGTNGECRIASDIHGPFT